MTAEKFALAVAAAIFASGVVGLFLQRVLPEEHTTGPSRDMIGAIAGLLTLLCALVTGLLIWTAYGVYAGQNTAIQTVASKVLQLDLALADYGPDANSIRAQLREGLGKTIDQVWGASENTANFVGENFSAAMQNMHSRDKLLQGLHPSTEEQKQALAAANSASDSLAQARLQMSFALSAPVSYPLLLVVICWVAVLFCGFGLTSRGTPMSLVAMAIGAIAVASAIMMILDLSSPYSGVFRASSAPLEQVLAVMGKE
jgi:hypothetical protein